MSLPRRDLLHFGRLCERRLTGPYAADGTLLNVYAEIRAHVLRFEYPPSELACMAADSAPRTSEERYLLSIAIASIREHETRLRKARTTLAEMRCVAAVESGEIAR